MQVKVAPLVQTVRHHCLIIEHRCQTQGPVGQMWATTPSYVAYKSLKVKSECLIINKTRLTITYIPHNAHLQCTTTYKHTVGEKS